MISQRTLVVRPLCGKLIHDTETFGKMDPYCRVVVGSQSQRTKVADGAGKFPSWQDELSFLVTGEEKIVVEIWDFDHSTQDDFVGSGSISVDVVKEQDGWEDWIEILHEYRKAGDIRLKIVMGPPGDKPGMATGSQIGNALKNFGNGGDKVKNDLLPEAGFFEGKNGFGLGDECQGYPQYPKTPENPVLPKENQTSPVSSSYSSLSNPPGPAFLAGPTITSGLTFFTVTTQPDFFKPPTSSYPNSNLNLKPNPDPNIAPNLASPGYPGLQSYSSQGYQSYQQAGPYGESPYPASFGHSNPAYPPSVNQSSGISSQGGYAQGSYPTLTEYPKLEGFEPSPGSVGTSGYGSNLNYKTQSYPHNPGYPSPSGINPNGYNASIYPTSAGYPDISSYPSNPGYPPVYRPYPSSGFR